MGTEYSKLWRPLIHGAVNLSNSPPRLKCECALCQIERQLAADPTVRTDSPLIERIPYGQLAPGWWLADKHNAGLVIGPWRQWWPHRYHRPVVFNHRDLVLPWGKVLWIS